MKTLSILETSKILSIPKDTLRYYDKMGLIYPKRGDNRYRYYTGEDILNLQYIEVMKFAGLSLKEIKQILWNRQECSGENLTDTIGLLENKKRDIEKKIGLYDYTLQLITSAVEMLGEKSSDLESEQMNNLIHTIYGELKGAVNEE